MKRYDFYPVNHQNGNRIEADNGEYVLAEDALRLQSELTKARELNGLLFEQARKRDALLNNEATECRGNPNSCPNNEGFGCDCIAHQSAPGPKETE